MSRQLGVLAVIKKVATFNGGLIADDLDKASVTVRRLADAAQRVTGEVMRNGVSSRAAFDELTAALAAFRGEA